jgi:DNA-binding CsgD family transcriptional regulator
MSKTATPPKGDRKDKPQHPRKHLNHHLAFEQADLASGGVYGRYVEQISELSPSLTPMELRVAAMVRALLPSWRIAELLGISEDTVENHRVKIRRKLGVSGSSLSDFLTHPSGHK